MQRRWKITGFMALVLFLLFSLCILGVLLTGADVYRKITEKDRTTYDRRTAVQYLTTKIRQSDAHGNLAVTEIDGIPALQLQEQVGDRVYVTHIYCAEGYIWELYAQQGSGLSAKDGERVLEAASLDFRWDPPMLTINIGFADGTGRQLHVTVRSEQEMI